MDKFKNAARIVLIISFIVLIYWLISKIIPIYNFVILGVLYEICWLPMLALLLVLPIINLYLIFKTKNNKLHYIGLFINIISLLTVAFF